MRHVILVLVSVAALFFDPSAGKGGVVEDIRERGAVVCGVEGALPGFSLETGGPGRFMFEGFDVDYCRAVAAAVLGDPSAVEFVRLSALDRFVDLAAGDADVLIRNTTHTFARDTLEPAAGIGFHFAPTTFHDGQGFMTDEPTGDIDNVDDLLDFLTGRLVCVRTGTTSEQNLEDLIGADAIETSNDPLGDYDAGACTVVSGDKSFLASQKGSLVMKDPDDQLIFQVTISKEPLGPVTRYGDQQWSDIVDWVVYVTFFAEEHGITMRNVPSFCRPGCTPEEEKVLGLSSEVDLGAALGLSRDWAGQVIGAVGNYAEIYDRNIVPIGIARSQQNESHVNGGLLFAPPF